MIAFYSIACPCKGKDLTCAACYGSGRVVMPAVRLRNGKTRLLYFGFALLMLAVVVWMAI